MPYGILTLFVKSRRQSKGVKLQSYGSCLPYTHTSFKSNPNCFAFEDPSFEIILLVKAGFALDDDIVPLSRLAVLPKEGNICLSFQMTPFIHFNLYQG